MTSATTVQVRLQLRADTAANWTANNPVLLANELGRETDTGKIKIGNGSTAWSSLAYQPFGAQITNADISATAEIAVSKLADGSARQLLQTAANGTDVEWASNIDIPGTLDVTGAATFDSSVTITGDLTVNGTTTNINTTNLVVEDKNVILGDVTTPSDSTADGGGITLKGATDKTITWIDSTDAWTLSEHVSIASGKEYRINGTKVLDATSLGSGVVSSSLTSVGTLSGLTVGGDITLNAQSDLRFADSDSSNWVAFQAPATVSSNVTWTLPSADGSSGQALSTNGTGTLSWAAFAALATVQTFTAAQRGTVSALTSATTVTPDFAVANNFSLTLAHSLTIANPSNQTAGQSGAIVITQGSGTAYTVSYGSNWKFSGGTPTMSTGLSSVSVLVYYVESASRITAQLLTNVT